MTDTRDNNEQKYDDELDTPGIIAILGDLKSGAVVTEVGVANMFRRHVTSVKRAVQRGELPPPTRLFGQNSWTVGALIRHIELRLEMVAKEADLTGQRIEALSP